MSLICEICQRDEVMAGQKLCAVCGEAIVRLANVVTVLQARASEELPTPVANNQNAKECQDECEAVLFSNWR